MRPGALVNRHSPTTPGSGAAVRLVDAAPDLGYLATANSPGNVTVTLTPQGSATAAATYASIGYGTASDYQTLPAGNYTVSVSSLGSVTPTATTTVTVSSGTVYTLFVTEPNTNPSYDLQLVSE